MIHSENLSFNGTTRTWKNVTPSNPCPKCKKPDQCSVSEDGDYCVCFRISEGAKQKTATDGRTYHVHRLTPLPSPTEPRYSLADGGGRLADPDTRHEIYSALLACLDLFEQHRKALAARGLKDGWMAAGYRSLPERRRYRAVRKLIEAGFERHLPNVPGFFVAEREGRYWTVGGMVGILIPVRDVQERIIALLVRPDETAGGKYQFLSSKKRGGPGPGAPIHCPQFKGDKTTVRVTEGALKADVATRLSGVLTIGLPGVGMWNRAAAVLHDLGAKTVRIALDADACRNTAVAEALHRLAGRLLDDGSFTVELEQWDESEGKGIDDLLARGKQPGLIQGDRVRVVADRILEAARAASPAGGDPGGGAKGPSGGPTGSVLILHHFRERYRPTFRRGAIIYSDALGREVRFSEACFAASTELRACLETANDCPKREGSVMRSALPKFFSTWAPVAWRDLLDQLQEEEQSAEVVGSAADEFRAKVAAGLHTHIALGYKHTDGRSSSDTPTTVERRSLVAWAKLFAKPGPWKSVRNYLLWCRVDERGTLQIALRVGLFASGQAHLRSLAEMGQYRFAQLAELYGVGTAQRAGGQRVVELVPEFVVELLTGPEQEQAQQKEQVQQKPEQARSREPGEEG